MRVQVIFHNLKKSDFVRTLVQERILSVLEKFPINQRGSAKIFVSMENSPFHSGPDLFGVKVLLHTPIKGAIVFSKKAATVFEATAGVTDRLLEVLHRQSDKFTHRRRASQRKWKELIRSPQPETEMY